MYRFLSLLLLTGCYYVNADARDTECSVDGVHVTTDHVINCEAVAVNMALGRAIMVERGYVTDWPAFIEGVEVEYVNARCLSGPSIGLIPLPGCLYGTYSAPHWERLPGKWQARPPTIRLNHDGGALVHELFHHLDHMRDTERATQHEGWQAEGFYQASDDFAALRLPVMGG